jgi:uncharacterized membrane protein YeaQ/YmgE (transglycosylase-associated protein family)
MWLLVGLIAGWLAGELRRGYGYGIVGNIVIGIIGAVVGDLMFDVLGIVEAGFAGDLLQATIGALAFLAVASWVRKETRAV